MIGDGLVVKQYQWIAAAQVLDAIRERLAADGPIAVTVAGESGSGKSEGDVPTNALAGPGHHRR